MKYYFQFLLCFLFIACSSDDDSVTGPTEGGSGVDIPDTGDDDNPLTYNASALLKNSADFPIGNIVAASKLTSNSRNNTDFKEVLEREYSSNYGRE